MTETKSFGSPAAPARPGPDDLPATPARPGPDNPPVAPARPGPDDPPKVVRPKLSDWKKKSLLLLAAIASLALAYGIGRLQGKLALDSAEERHGRERQALQTELATLQAERDLLSARRSLSLVALALDRRNFGVAETHRRETLEALARPSVSSLPGVASLTGGVRELRLDVDPDPGTKRDRVIATTEALDRLSAANAKPTAAGSAGSKP